jgi:hypothetical protein
MTTNRLRAVTIYFDFDTDSTILKWNNEFLDSHRITKLDILGDAGYDLKKAYDDAINDKPIQERY